MLPRLAMIALLLGAPGCSNENEPRAAATVELLNVSYDPTRELWKDVNEHFAAAYQKETGNEVEIKQSHGGSSSQARAVIDGLEADVVTLATYVDTDGEAKDLLEILGNHGFNYIRLRTFVDPDALYGYANPNGQAQYRKAESYCDTEHTLIQAQQVKQAGMGLLLDLHYSDNWADPGKQIIPAAWRGVSTIDALASEVEAYTKSVVEALVD